MTTLDIDYAYPLISIALQRKATEDKFFDTCMEGASKSGKNQKLQIKYCTCIVDYIDERYSDEQFLKFQKIPEKFND